MTTLRRACAVAALACLFALTPRAGDMSAGYTNPPNPTPTPQPAATREPAEPGPNGLRPAADNSDAPAFEAVLALLQSMFLGL